VRKLKQPKKVQQGRLRSEEGEVVASECRAETMASYLEKVQWCVRLAQAVDSPALGEELPVRLDSFSTEEVRRGIWKLRSQRAAGHDEIAPEYLKALLSNSEALSIMVEFLNKCWLQQEIPEDWHLAVVTAIHKKGRADLCENYRPISLLCIFYKLFAALVHRRLVEAGAEDRLSSSQFGFRSHRSTTDAIFTLRRKIDTAWAQRGGRLMILALDWKKAFDSIDPAALLAALKRFGLPAHVLGVIGSIYAARSFQVRDAGHTSELKPQGSGISQGCPLSPFLFVMLMTVLMRDVVDNMTPQDRQLFERGDLADLLYADDTLLLSLSAASLERVLSLVSHAGAAYGLELHAGKFQLVQVRCDAEVESENGVAIEPKPDLVYLGSLISEDGKAGPEMERRLGIASGDFRRLSRLWRHASLGRQRKLEILNALVFSKLLYGMPALWLNKAERRKLNGFQNRCLRAAWGIKPAFLSRVSNVAVLATTGQTELTKTLERRQLLLYGRVARQTDDHPMRAATFTPGSLQPAVDRYVRKVGRPRSDWTTQVGNLALQVAGGQQRLQETLFDAGSWREVVDNHT